MKIIRFSEGIEAYKKSLEIKPDDEEALTNMGNAFAGLKQFKEAIECYDRVLARNTSFYLAYQNKGMAKIELGQNEIGIACLNKALAINSNLPASYNNKVRTFYDRKNEEMIFNIFMSLSSGPSL